MNDSLDTEKADTRETSRLSLNRMGARELAGKMAEILDVVTHCHRQGMIDVSLTEIRDVYEATLCKRIDLNRVSARVYDLVNAGKLERQPVMRPCSKTGRMVHAVKAVAQQARLAGVA